MTDAEDAGSNNASDAVLAVIKDLHYMTRNDELNFKDFDHNKNGCLPTSTFDRVLQQYATQQQIAVLCKFFARSNNLGQSSERPDVDYEAVKEAIANYALSGTALNSADYRCMVRNRKSKLGSSVLHKNTPTKKAVNINALLQDIAEFCERENVRIDEFFKEYDKLNHGVVTQAKFVSTLAQLNMERLDSDEIQSLVEAFPADGIYATDHCNWSKFVSVIEPKDSLEQNPDAIVKGRGQTHYRRSSFEQDDRAIAISKIRNAVETHGIHLKPAFRDFDKLNRRIIRTTNFNKVLDNLKVKEKTGLSQPALDNLAISYQVIKKGRKTDDIDYYTFVKDVDPGTEKF